VNQALPDHHQDSLSYSSRREEYDSESLSGLTRSKAVFHVAGMYQSDTLYGSFLRSSAG
jgi:hypothetical protein